MSLNNDVRSYFFWSILDCFGTSDETCSSSGNETDLLTRGGISMNCAWFSQMLMVTTTMRMVNGVHSNTSYLRESFSESLELVEQHTGLHDRLFISASSGDDPNGGSAGSWDGFSRSRGQSDSRPCSVFWVTDDRRVGSRASRVRTFISNSRFDITNGCSFRNSIDWENIADGHGSLPPAEQVLPGVCSFRSQEVFCSMFVSVRVSEVNFQEGSSSSWIMHDGSYYTFNISLSFCIVQVTIARRCDSLWFRCSVHTARLSFPLTCIIMIPYIE